MRWKCGTLAVHLAAGLFLALLPGARLQALVISEIMYHPGGPGDTSVEFVELYNEIPDPLDLTGYRLCSGVDFAFPQDTFLDGSSYLVVCRNAEAIRAKYGIAVAVGDYQGSLDDDGEAIEICSPGGNIVARVEYGDRSGWPSGADGTGHSLALISPYRAIDDSRSWRLSLELGGSPGMPNGFGDEEAGGPRPGAGPGASPVLINEGFFPAAGPRWVELYNSGDVPVDLTGYFLTDDPSSLKKGPLPAGTSVPARSWISFQDDQLGLDFSARPWIFIALVEPAGRRVADAYNFTAAHEGMSEARVPDGGMEFSVAADATRGAANRTSTSRDIVINEIMYDPIDGDPSKEYIELHNRGSTAADLSGWRLSGSGMEFRYPPELTIPAGGYVVVARDPDSLLELHGLREDQITGPFTGRLGDSGDRVVLKDALGRTVDDVEYQGGGEWPGWADGLGSSLELIDPFQDNSLAQAWDASDDSAKAEARAYSYKGRHWPGESELALVLLARGICLVDDVSVLAGTLETSDAPLVDAGEAWRYFKGTQEPPAGWKDPGFNDAAWQSGPTEIGFGDGDEATVLSDMADTYLTVFCRRVFHIADPGAFDSLVLSVLIDDGFYAYINGVEVAAYNVSGKAFDAPAATVVEPAVVERDISRWKGLLVSGANVLAVQAHNSSLVNHDFSLTPRLLARTTRIAGGRELLGNGGFEADAAGWMSGGTHVRSGRTTREPLSGAGSLEILASGPGDDNVNRVETPDAAGSGLASIDPDAAAQISFKARWVVGSQTLLTSGSQHELARAHPLHVPPNLGTPGRINSVTERRVRLAGSANLGPVIGNLRQDPALPGAGQPVKIQARIVDPDRVSEARVRWSLGNPSASPQAAVMTPLGGDVYEGTIPGQPSGATVLFFLEAFDSGGRPGRYPADITARTHPLLLDPAQATPGDQHHRVYRHGSQPSTSAYPAWQFFMSQASESYLSNRQVLSDDLVEGSLVFAGQRIYHGAAIRFSGSPWNRRPWGSFFLSMPADDPLHGRFRELDLKDHGSSGGTDARERIAHYLIRKGTEGGFAMPYTDAQTIVSWQVNGRTMPPLEAVPSAGESQVSLWYPEDDGGDLISMNHRMVTFDGGVRVDGIQGRLLYPPPSPRGDGDGENKENYRMDFTLRTRSGADDYSNLIAFARVMDPRVTPDWVFDRDIGSACNVEEFLRMWAVSFNIDDWYCWGASRGTNCWFYRTPSDGRFQILSGDMDMSFGNVSSFLLPADPADPFKPGAFEEVNRMLNRPAVKRMYYAILKEMVDGPGGWFHSSHLSTYATKLAEIGMVNTHVALPGGFIDQRAAMIRIAIQPLMQVAFAITTNGGDDFTWGQETANLFGTAPAEAQAFLLVRDRRDPVLCAVQFMTMTTWRIADIRLRPGRNLLRVLALDLRSNLVASDQITVTSTAPQEPFIRGDVDGDGSADVSDAVKILLGLFAGLWIDCEDAADADDSEDLNITDAIVLLEYLFRAGLPPRPPFPSAGTDPGGTTLGCFR